MWLTHCVGSHTMRLFILFTLIMTKYKIFLFLFVIAASCHAQSANKRYRSYLSERGTVNFIRPFKLGNKNNIDLFEFDMTYVSYSDSITINCTLKTKRPNIVRALELRTGCHEVIDNDVYLLYRDVLKDGYEMRITSRFSFDDIKRIYKSTSPCVFKVIFNDGSWGTATYSKSKWKSEHLNMTRILESINF